MNLIELLFLIVCLWILYIGISFAFQDIREAEKELEEVKKQLKQEKEDSRLLAELLLDKQGYFMKILIACEYSGKLRDMLIIHKTKERENEKRNHKGFMSKYL